MIQVMSDGDRGGESFEEKLRAFARELGQSVERVTGNVDVDEIADRIDTGGDRVRELTGFAGRWLQDLADDPAARGTAPRQLRRAGPDPRDLPTEEQGLALGALDSGRWKVEPETDELISEGEEPKPIERPGLVGELRTRDWITADGEVTFLGRAALRRWQKSTTPS
jgi:hypothetical protein